MGEKSMTRKMKDSGIEWIGEIPEEWETIKIKHLFNVSRGRVISKLEINDNGKYPVYSSQTENDGIFGYLNTYDYSGESLTWTTDGEKAGTVFYRKGKYNCTNICGILQKKKKSLFKTDIRFLFYAIKMVAEENKRPDTNGHKIMSNEMERLCIPITNYNNQVKIGTILDNITKNINNTHNLIKKEIENLEDYKKSVITEAVTKGLYKNVEMKDSGIEWIGEIPKHWKVNRLKFLVIDRQAGIWGKEVESEGEDRNIICIRVADFDFPRMTIRKDRGFTVRNYSNIDIIKYYLDKGDILVEKSGGGEKSPVGRTIIWEENFVAVYANFIERIRMDQNKICPMYAQYVFYAFYNMGISNLFFNQTTGIQNLDLSKMIRTLRFPVPSLNDQLNIINYLNKVIKILDETIEAKQKQLEILEEYRKSLIYEYVTGKKEVEDGEET